MWYGSGGECRQGGAGQEASQEWSVMMVICVRKKEDLRGGSETRRWWH